MSRTKDDWISWLYDVDGRLLTTPCRVLANEIVTDLLQAKADAFEEAAKSIEAFMHPEDQYDDERYGVWNAYRMAAQDCRNLKTSVLDKLRKLS